MNPLAPIRRLHAGSAQRWLRLLMAASVLLPLLILVVVAWHDYDEMVVRSAERIERTTRIAREHALKVFETNEIILRRVRDLIGTDNDAAVLAREEGIHAKLREIAEGVPQVQAIWIWNAEGRPLASSGSYPVPVALSIADRDDFRDLQLQGARLVFSDTLRGPATGRAYFIMNERRDESDGRFGGAITIALSPEYFAAFYEEVAARDPAMTIALARPDGSVITRFPDAPAPGIRVGSHDPLIPLIEGKAATAVSLATSPEDGKRRYVMAQRVGEYPLLVSVGLLRSAVVDAWMGKLWLPAAAAFTAGLALLLLSSLSLQKTRREQAAVAQWQAEATRRAAAERALSHLSQHLIRLSEGEKAKLAAELHDELGGALSAMALDLAWVLERLRSKAPELVERQNQALKLVQETAVLKRRIIDGLRPMLLQHLGLDAALRDHVAQWSKKTGIPVELSLPDQMPVIADDAALALFRVVQESLTNVANHANARAVNVTIAEHGEDITVEVADDGVGISPETLAHPTSHGITGMQQRVAQFGGSFEVRSAIGTGTRITASIASAATPSAVLRRNVATAGA